MDATLIKQYAQIMQDMDLTALEISEGGQTCLRLERACGTTPAAVPTGIPVAAPATAAPAAPEADASKPPANDPAVTEILSPMVGVFYTASAENQRPFVSIGDKVKKGDVLCIIEAMKLLNEITCDIDGEVIEICAGNQQVVDYGHPLFRIRKEAP